MRKIHFRVWIKSDEEYEEEGRMVFPVWTGLPISSKDTTFEFEMNKEGDRSEYLCSEVIWMQCAGMKDRKGKYIYEGDICRYWNPQWWDEGKRVPSKQIKVIEWNNKTAGWSVRKGDRLQIIGNIYKNPELLTTKKG